MNNNLNSGGLSKTLGTIAHWFGEHWQPVISIISLIIAVSTWYSAHEEKKEYDNTASAAIQNAGEMVVSNIDGLYAAIATNDSNFDKRSDYQILLTQIREQYRIISDLDVAHFSTKDTISYQISRSTFLATSDNLNKTFNAAYKNGKMSAKGRNQVLIMLLFERYNIHRFMKGMKTDNEYISNDKTMRINDSQFAEKYKNKIRVVEKEAGTR